MNLKFLIADDERLARERLVDLLADVSPDSTVVAQCKNGVEALEQCIKHQPDVALLDIRMPTLSGLQVAHEIQKQQLATHVIFVTAYDQHALEAFEKNAIDYLLKPIRSKRLEQSLKKVSPQPHQSTAAIARIEPRQHLCSSSQASIKTMAIKDVLYFRADNKYVEAVSATSSLLLDEPLKALEQEFEHDFLRVHRSILVNRRAIKGVKKNTQGEWQVELHDSDVLLSVSRRHHSDVKNALLDTQP